jgi:hypothetical protein
MTFHRLFFCRAILFLAGILLVGCATRLTPQEVSSSTLMPEAVAIKIFQKYGISDIRQPFSGGLPPICGGGIISDISIKEVISISYFPVSKQVIMRSRGFLTDGRCPVGSILYNVNTENDAKELLQASIAMGAKVDTIQILKPFWK